MGRGAEYGSYGPRFDGAVMLGKPGDSRPPEGKPSFGRIGSFVLTEHPMGIQIANGRTPRFKDHKGILIPEKVVVPQRIIKEQDPRKNLERYQTTGERINLDLETNAELRDMIEGIGKFKKYNVHEQLSYDKKNGALALGEGQFRVPNKDRFPFLFLHDSSYMAKADNGTPEGSKLTENALDKFCDVYEQYGLIPNFAATPSLNATALPMMISMAWEWYNQHPDKDDPAIKAKLQRYMTVGADEHDTVWNNSDDLSGAIGSYHHVFSPDSRLRRVGDRDAGYATNSGREWFWDFSTVRGAGSENRLAPICLNSILSRNEEILAEASEELGIDIGDRTPDQWRAASDELKNEIKAKNYDPVTKTYHDFDYVSQQRREEATLAAAWTLWGGIASGEEVLDIVGKLAELDSGHGLMVTSPEDLQQPVDDDAIRRIGIRERYLPAIHTLTKDGNWDANIWPPTLITLKEGIIKYSTEDFGLSTEDRLKLVRFAIVQTQNEIRTQLKIFQDEGVFAEKWLRDGTRDKKSYHYEEQKSGLGWSATLAELNITRFLPQLYALEDELVALRGLNVSLVQEHNVYEAA